MVASTTLRPFFKDNHWPRMGVQTFNNSVTSASHLLCAVTWGSRSSVPTFVFISSINWDTRTAPRSFGVSRPPRSKSDFLLPTGSTDRAGYSNSAILVSYQTRRRTKWCLLYNGQIFVAVLRLHILRAKKMFLVPCYRMADRFASTAFIWGPWEWNNVWPRLP